MANILFVEPKLNWPQGYCEAPNQALLLLATLAKNRGHKVLVQHRAFERNPVDAVSGLNGFNPDIVALTVNTFMVKDARQVIKETRSLSKDIPIILGGPHACVWEAETDYKVDKVVVGEGENPFLEFIGETPDFKDMDSVDIDFSLVDLKRFPGISGVGAVPSMCYMASRGCPFDCIYCNTPLFWGKTTRRRSPELVVADIKHLHDQYGAREVFFQDDTFNINLKWATEIFERIIKAELNRDMVFRCCMRANEKMINAELLKLASRAGVWNIFVGVESGNQGMLDSMKKGITKDDVRRAVRLIKEAHIRPECSFIVGLPGETRDTLRETGQFIKEIKPGVHGWGYACPFPCTELDRIVTEKGHKLPFDYADYIYGRLYCRTDALSIHDMQQFATTGYPN